MLRSELVSGRSWVRSVLCRRALSSSRVTSSKSVWEEASSVGELRKSFFSVTCSSIHTDPFAQTALSCICFLKGYWLKNRKYIQAFWPEIRDLKFTRENLVRELFAQATRSHKKEQECFAFVLWQPCLFIVTYIAKRNCRWHSSVPSYNDVSLSTTKMALYQVLDSN